MSESLTKRLLRNDPIRLLQPHHSILARLHTWQLTLRRTPGPTPSRTRLTARSIRIGHVHSHFHVRFQDLVLAGSCD